MITFIIKSTICLVVFYGFYHFLLHPQKILFFNRFFLIFSLVFSLIIPLIIIPVKSNFQINIAVDKFTLTTGQLIIGGAETENAPPMFGFHYIVLAFFIIISSILLIRYSINIFRIIKKIRKNKRVEYSKTTLVFIEERILPYSFFKYIFVNRQDFEDGKIEKELLLHEEAHCLQYHSIDIIIIELIYVFLWFNPAIWLFKKALLLNHEYLADNIVLKKNDLVNYQQLLLNILLQNNSNYLVSNFKYSSIKNRLEMMTKINPSHHALPRKISAIMLFFFIAISLTFSQDNKKTRIWTNFEKEWWYPILQKHNKIPSGFNNFRNIFEMGEKNSINDEVCTLTNAYVIIRDSLDNYMIIESPLLYHDFKRELIITNSGTWKMYKKDSPMPYSVMEITKMELHALKN